MEKRIVLSIACIAARIALAYSAIFALAVDARAASTASVPDSPIETADQPQPNGYVGNLTDHRYSEGFRLSIEPHGISLLVRSVNVCMQDEYCDPGPLENEDPGPYFRLERIAGRLHTDHPSQVGLIGLQEAGAREFLLSQGEELYCESLGEWTFAAECLANEMEQLSDVDHQVSSYDKATVGALVGSDWTVVGKFSDWLLTDAVGAGKHQGLVELLVEHESGLRLRFYSLKLGPGSAPDNQWFRYLQAERLINLIRDRAQPGELPPIVVGDFNHWREYHERGRCPYDGSIASDRGPDCVSDASVQLMEKYFWRPLDSRCDEIGSFNNIDMVYIARTADFFGPAPCGLVGPELVANWGSTSYDWLVPGSLDHFEVLEHRRLAMQYEVPRVADQYFAEITELEPEPAPDAGPLDFTERSAEIRMRVLFDQPIDPASFTPSDVWPMAEAVVPVEGSEDCKREWPFPGNRVERLCENCDLDPLDPLDADDSDDICEFEVTIILHENSLLQPNSELEASIGSECTGAVSVGPGITSRKGLLMDQSRDGFATGWNEDASYLDLGCIFESPEPSPTEPGIADVIAEFERVLTDPAVTIPDPDPVIETTISTPVKTTSTSTSLTSTKRFGF